NEGSMSYANYTAAKSCLLADIQDAVVINLTPPVIADAVRILEGSRTRAMDALHVACAQVWGAEVFVSADRRQIAAAKKIGLRTRAV
ncbi:MAG: type II toxin-antitoxin system VapC family toxin, partial [Candidatus Aureabacteria bacterium]|nr:type II toxin-antitoxin system VapC family toxin [Candidatus Auribacterota bacterium]